MFDQPELYRSTINDAVERLAENMALSIENALREEITAIVGEGWNLEDMAGRLTCEISADGEKDYFLDRMWLLRLGPRGSEEIVHDGNVIRYTIKMARRSGEVRHVA